KGVLFEKVWIHDTADFGFAIDDELGESGAALRDALVEGATFASVINSGGDLAVSASVVRGADTAPGTFEAMGVVGKDHPETSRRGTTKITGCLLEQNRDAGAAFIGTDGAIEATEIRDTKPAVGDTYGYGAYAECNPASGECGKLLIATSVLER